MGSNFTQKIGVCILGNGIVEMQEVIEQFLAVSCFPYLINSEVKVVEWSFTSKEHK
jgi:hypothetical protein